MDEGELLKQLTTHIHLFDALRTWNLPFNPELPSNLSSEDKVKHEALNLIALCLAIDPDDHVVVVEGNREFVVAKAKSTTSEDDDRAKQVFKTLHTMRTDPSLSMKLAASKLVEHDFVQALLQEQVRDLAECISQDHVIPDVKQAIEEIYEAPKCQKFFDLVDRLKGCVSALSAKDKLDIESLFSLRSLARGITYSGLPRVHKKIYGVSEPQVRLRTFVQWFEAVSSLVGYLTSKSSAFIRHRLILTTSVPHSTPVKLDLQSTLQEIACTILHLDLEGEDGRLLNKLMKTWDLKDGQTFSPATRVHPEIKVILDEGLRDTSASAFQGIHIIGSNVSPCVWCTIWVHLYNERFNTAWRCKHDDYFDRQTDWAAPNRDRTNVLNPGALNDLSKALLEEVRRLLSAFKFIEEQLEDLRYVSIGTS